jgi:predicted ATPase
VAEPVQGPSARFVLRLFGDVALAGEGRQITLPPARAVQLLLARLAMAPDQAHTRETLAEALWPGQPGNTGRSRLRQVLFQLRALLEAAGADGLLQVDKSQVRVRPGWLDSDVRRFEQALHDGELAAARALYRGELLPGHYDDWVQAERLRLAERHERLLQALHAAPLQQGRDPSMPLAGSLQTPPMPSASAAAASAVSAAAGPAPSASRSTASSAGPHGESVALPATAPAASAAAAEAPRFPAPPAPPTPSASPGRPVAVELLGLPHHTDRSIGTAERVAELRGQLGLARLVTVHGPGGNGKTRLAIDTAASLAETAGRGAPMFERIAFVSLIDCITADALLEALCAALRLAGTAGAAERLAAALGGCRTLMVLDNLEQIDAGAEAAIAALLQAAPGLQVLATSRRLLGLPGEQAFELPGLALPALDASATATLASPAASLFVERARAVRPGFSAGPAQWRAVGELVRLLAGMPLAIELAASRMRSLSPTELLARLQRDEGSPLLDTLARQAGRLGVEHRHGSMRHVVAWSWRQLNPPQQDLLRAMALFASPAPVAAIAAVAHLDEDAARDGIEQLEHHSLVLVQPAGRSGTRYALLQPVREFVLERTEAHVALARRRRLRRWLIDFGHAAAARGPAAMHAVAAELPLLLSAVPAAVADGAPEEAAALVEAFRRHWEIDLRQGVPASTAATLERIEPGLTDARLRCGVNLLLAGTYTLAGRSADGAAAAERARALAPDAALRARAMHRLAQARMQQGLHEPALASLIDDTLALAREANERETEALALRLRFLIATNRDRDFALAERLAERTQQVWESLGHRRNAGIALMDRASVWCDLGRFDEAAEALALCEAIARDDDYSTGYITASWQVGRVAIRRRRGDEALAASLQVLADFLGHARTC